jgi:hypothetical protein
VGWRAGKEDAQAGAAEKEEGQPFSQGGWPFHFLLPQRLWSSWGTQAEQLCVCAGKNHKPVGGLTGRGWTWAAQRAAREVFYGVNSTPGDIDDWVLAVGYALNADFPNLLKHIQTHDYEGDGRKSQREKRKGCYELAYEIELQREHNP